MARPASPHDSLHLIDADAPADPLLRLVLTLSSRVLRRRLSDPLLRWRATRDIRQIGAGQAVTWGEAAAELARRADVRRCIYRPADGAARPALPWSSAVAVADCESAARRLRRAGWAASRVSVVPPPVFADTAVSRREIGADADDYLWLLPSSPTDADGLRQAVWAAAIVHVIERGRRRHRVVIPGDGPAQRLAVRFADQIGLVGLCVGVPRYDAASLAASCDAALLLPTRPGAAHAAAVIARTGLPTVIADQPEVVEVLSDRAGVRVAPERKPRVVARDMLSLSESHPLRRATDERFAPEAVARTWHRVLHPKSGV